MNAQDRPSPDQVFYPQPPELSEEVEAQLRKLEALNDRTGLKLLWRAIRETSARAGSPPARLAGFGALVVALLAP